MGGASRNERQAAAGGRGGARKPSVDRVPGAGREGQPRQGRRSSSRS